MKKPMLQIALDTLTIKEARTVTTSIQKYIDIIEVGTILISSKGVKAIKKLKQ
jgi:3-dehydro-L-gulonate-6-phosphate decarboxylase